MITQREEYDFVTIPSTIKIDGGIMPKRDVDADGSWRILRGEDDAFLYESACERYVACGVSADRMTMGLKAEPIGFRKACECASSLYMAFADPDYTPQDIVEYSSSSDVPWKRIETTYCDIDAFGSGKPLVADEARKVFFDMKRMRITANGHGSISHGDDAYSWASLVQASGRTEDPEPPHYTYEKIKAFQRGGRQSYSGESSVSSESYSINVHDYVDSATVFFRVSCQYLASGSSDSKDYYVNGGDFSVSDGAVSIGAEDLLKAAKTAYAAFGHDVDVTSLATTSDEDSWCRAQSTLGGVYCKLGDHTDISGTGWTWTP